MNTSRDNACIRIAGPDDVGEIMRVINLAFRNAESFFIERDRVDRPHGINPGAIR